MTVAELIAAFKDVPPDYPVVASYCLQDFDIVLVAVENRKSPSQVGFVILETEVRPREVDDNPKT